MWSSDKEESCGYQWKQKQIPVDGKKVSSGVVKVKTRK